MLQILGIDKEKCIKCEKCTSNCTERLFSVVRDGMEKEIVFADPYRLCSRCGHCISICPTEAIQYKGADDPYEFEEIAEPEKMIPYDTLKKFIRARRSIRNFKDKPVPKEVIEKILDAMRYAPTASNRQRQYYIVITDKDQIRSLSKQVMKLFLFIRKLLKFKHILAPFTPKGLRKQLKSKKTQVLLDMYHEHTEQGEDLVFFDAPCVIVLHSPTYSKMTGSDGGISLTHGMLAAQSLGLGTTWIGFAHEFLTRNRKYRKKLGIPKHHNCFGVLVLGYPKYKFERAPPRRPVKVRWIE